MPVAADSAMYERENNLSNDRKMGHEQDVSQQSPPELTINTTVGNSAQHQGRELFVGDLSYFCREQHIQQLFSNIGKVVSVRIRRSDRRGHSLMHGFIKMTTPEDAQRAVASYDGYLFMGRRMRVQLCTPNGPENPSSPTKHGIQIHTSFISYQTINKVVTEDTLRAMFEYYGEVVDAIICRHKIQQSPPKQSGYGFIYMATQEGANRAMEYLAQFDIDGIRFDSMFSHRTTRSANQQTGANSSELPQMPSTNRYGPPMTAGTMVLPYLSPHMLDGSVPLPSSRPSSTRVLPPEPQPQAYPQQPYQQAYTPRPVAPSQGYVGPTGQPATQRQQTHSPPQMYAPLPSIGFNHPGNIWIPVAHPSHSQQPSPTNQVPMHQMMGYGPPYPVNPQLMANPPPAPSHGAHFGYHQHQYPPQQAPSQYSSHPAPNQWSQSGQNMSRPQPPTTGGYSAHQQQPLNYGASYYPHSK